jgi:hypothetical protein
LLKMEKIPQIISNSLTTLKLASNLEEHSLDQISIALDKNTSVTSISVTTKGIRNKKLFEYLRRTTTIKTLTLAKNNTASLSSGGFEHVSKLLVASEIVNVSFPGFQRTDLSDESAQLIAVALEANQHIQSVEIEDHELSDFGLGTILQAVSRHSSIINLYLNNKHCSDFIAAIVAFVSVNESVVHLGFVGCGIDAAGMRLLSDALQGNKTIRRLGLARSNLNSSSCCCE